MYCLVEMPVPAAVATTKVRGMLVKRMSGKLPAPAALAAEKLKPMAAAPQGKTEAQKMGAQSKQARKKAEEDKLKQKKLDTFKKNQAKEGFGKPQPQNPEDLKPLRGPTPQKQTTAQRGSALLEQLKAEAKAEADKVLAELENKSDYTKWSEIKRGNYGKVSVSPDGTRAVKELLTGKDGKQGEFGEHEIELAKKMGQLGHSPKIHRATDKALEMDVAPGAPLWKGYQRGEDEPAMNTAQATKAARAIQDLHRLGFAHGDMHSQQFLVDGDNVKLVDYGLSQPISKNPVRVMQDLAKSSSLVKWQNPELAKDPYVQIVNRHLPAYREIKGTSKKANAERERIAQEYLRDLKTLGPIKTPAAPKTATAAEEGGSWTQRYTDRGATVAKAQKSLEDAIKKLPPQEQAQWNEVANKQLVIKLNSSREKKPLPPEEVDNRLAGQMNAITRLIQRGKPEAVYDRRGVPIEGVKLVPVITATGHAKWMNEENNRRFSFQKIPGRKESGWVQSRTSGEDTARRLPDLEAVVKRDGKKWALYNDENFQRQRHQRGDRNDDRVYTTDKATGERRKKTVDEIEREMSGRKGISSNILTNGVDKSGNEGIVLLKYYDKNPEELKARYRDGIQAWLDQGGISLASGKRVALPGVEPGPGEERSSIDHFTPISTYRNKGLSAEELRQVVDNHRNFNIVEESFNSQRGSDPWLDWATEVIAKGGVGSAAKAKNNGLTEL
jgi:tRNA A-37 threonylcarbamoyl transferase component Bud32